MIETHPEIAFADAADIRSVNEHLLRRHVRYCYENSPYYRALFEARGLGPDAIACAADLVKLPVTTKADLERASADGTLLAVEPGRIVDLCQTSGTTGRPISFLQTESDLQRLAINEATALALSGVKPGQRVLIACALGRCFMAGLAYFLGCAKLGATAIRGGSGVPELLAQMIIDHRPEVLIAVPSRMAALADALEAKGHDPADAGLALAVCIGEPIRLPGSAALSPLGEKIRDRWKIRLSGTYASTEMATSFNDCPAGTGGHVNPELICVEIVDEAGRHLPPGAPGEVIATPLQVTGMPLLRLATCDIASLDEAPCACGRRTARLSPILGRKQQMLKIKGTTIFAPAIFNALNELPGVANACLDITSDYDLSDRVRVSVGGDLLDAARIAEHLRSRIRVSVEVEVHPAETLAARIHDPASRKPVLVFDHRRQTGLPPGGGPG